MKNFFGSDPSMRIELEQRLAAGINLPDAERLGVALPAVRSCVIGTSGPDPLAQRLVTAFVRPAVPMAGTHRSGAVGRSVLWPPLGTLRATRGRGTHCSISSTSGASTRSASPLDG